MIGLKSHIYPKMFCEIRTKPQKNYLLAERNLPFFPLPAGEGQGKG
jgi:hypothetical protein